MPRIPQATVEQIKARADIFDIVSEVVDLKKQGTSYVGLCPFHDDKNPSFSVAPAKGIYRCFSCGNGGNAITFVMEYDKITYVEALQKLAKRYNIPLNWSKQDKNDASNISQLYELHDYARQYYHKKLFTAEGKKALQYLHNRGFTDAVIKEFAIGYAGNAWEGLLTHVNRKTYHDSVLKKSGLFIERKQKNGFFDRFRHRVMFPIKNISGRTIAFGGRALDPGEKAKYMNSPETPIYNKSKVLFGFDISKDAIRKKEYAIVIEGYTDFLRLYTAGFQNIVAGSGTALTPGHASTLKRFTNKVYLCYDGDEAGQKATIKAGFIFLKAGFDVRVIVLPEKDDPDSFIQSQGAAAYQEKVETAPDFISFILQRNRKRLQSPVEKSEFIERMVREIADIEDNVVRDLIAKNLSEQMEINEERIFSQMAHFLNKKRYREKFKKKADTSPSTPTIESAADKAEFSIIQIVLTQKENLIDYIYQHLDAENLSNATARKIFSLLTSRLEAGQPIDADSLYDEEWEPTERKLLTKAIDDAEVLEKKEDDILFPLATDCIENILLQQIDDEIKTIRIKMKNAQKNGDDVLQLMHDYKNRQEQKKLISEALREMGEE